MVDWEEFNKLKKRVEDLEKKVKQPNVLIDFLGYVTFGIVVVLIIHLTGC